MFSRKKNYQKKSNSPSVTWKNLKKWSSVLYTPNIVIIDLFRSFFFFGKERILRLKLYIRMKNVPWGTFFVYNTLILLVNFSMYTTYKKPILLIFRHLLKDFWKTGRDEKKMAFIFVFNRKKVNWVLKNYSWEIFLQVSVIRTRAVAATSIFN